MAEIRVESFPFDSDFDGYDDKGYPVYDRAVDARTYRSSLEQFFSDGVFGTPANALQIGKGSGLSVTIQPGIGIIRGAIGGVFEDPVTLELDAKPPQGNIAYSIMLRCDDNDDRRSMFLTVVKGTADTDPTPPAPTENALIKDIRLGYVVVPSGATDLANATVTNEKGLSVCPYAAPFEEIDVDGIVSDFRVAANEALTKLLEYFQKYEGVVDSALNDTEAGYLQQQITAIQEQLANTDLSGSVDNETIEYNIAAGQASAKLRVKPGGIGDDQISAGRSLVNTTNGSNGQVLSFNNGGLLWIGNSKIDLLWSGSSSSDISVSNVSNYDFFIVVANRNTDNSVILCKKVTVQGSQYIMGSAGDVSRLSNYLDNRFSPGQYFSGFCAQVSGESLSPSLVVGSSSIRYFCIIGNMGATNFDLYGMVS